MRACSNHPAVLGYSVGNEIPSPIVRWHGRRRVERFIHRLYRTAKAEDPDALVTYVNYPTTEFLELPFLDLVSFNVYLESKGLLKGYLARLQNLTGNRPLVLAEVGLDSRSNGEEEQARSLDWQVRAAYEAGSAGTFVFSWTDEWHRGGYDIEDWDFGLTTRRRHPKPALAGVQEVFAGLPFQVGMYWPRISVVVCAHNEERHIGRCLEGVLGLEYPDFEVVVVDDGSTDTTAAVVAASGIQPIRTENLGLSSARNAGMQAATGSIVAYIDADADPDPHWLHYLASDFLNTDHVAVGGPNVAPAGISEVAKCVDKAPGGPVHILLTDQEAEHIPGCNMAFRKDALQAVGGFDPQFRIAGDDVDVCWKLQQQGWTLGFNPAAMVWHHPRDLVSRYWRQQLNYGRAEALLERKWPEKYNRHGHVSWAGRIYADSRMRPLPLRRSRIYHGVWGTGLFQRLYAPSNGKFQSFPLMPEWFLVIFFLAGLSALGSLWRPLLIALPLLLLAAGAVLVQAGLGAMSVNFNGSEKSRVLRLKRCLLTTWLHILHPLARLLGRLHYDLTPWRKRGGTGFSVPRVRTFSIWSEQWKAPEEWLQSLESIVKADRFVVHRGDVFDRWDLEVWGGLQAGARVLMSIEEHGAGKQLLRFRTKPRVSFLGMVATAAVGVLSVIAGLDHAWIVAALLGLSSVLLLTRAGRESTAATSSIGYAVQQIGSGQTSDS